MGAHAEPRPDRRVIGLGLAEAYLTYARTRHALPNLHFEIGDAGHLPCTNGAFAASLSQLVLTFVTDPEQVAAEMVRVTRQGGVVAATVWDFCEGSFISGYSGTPLPRSIRRRVVFAIDCFRIRSARLTA